MKKLALVLTMIIGSTIFAANESTPFRTGPLSFPSSFGGILYSNATRAMYRENKTDLSRYTVLGNVQSQAEMCNVLLLANWGDTSLGMLKKQALAALPDADDIVNIEIDAHTFNICLIYCKTTVFLRGVAVKYKKR